MKRLGKRGNPLLSTHDPMVPWFRAFKLGHNLDGCLPMFDEPHFLEVGGLRCSSTRNIVIIQILNDFVDSSGEDYTVFWQRKPFEI